MSRLHQLQRDLQHSLLQQSKAPAIKWVSGAGRGRPQEQLDVYLHGYQTRLREVLAEDFSALAALLGEAVFERLCKEYIARHPSRSFTLREFGQHLPTFLRQWRHDTLCAGWAELATFEWSLLAAFDAADTPPATEQDLAQVPNERWPALCISLHPSVQCLAHNWNSTQLWQAYKQEQPFPPLQPLPERESWLVWREGMVTRFSSITEAQHIAVDAMHQGQCFAEICERLSTVMEDEEIPLYAASLIKTWIHKGLISQLR